ncbi:hypothetical protein [Saccharothrix sp. ST-888]|uniref:hypothetical protein n=1 Tax=Saccharothrix sp. ST-888 TaxID=1427391 RepID=UPI0006974A2E|nr:hypothetical protein [Saccharothrix sp. ST-888]
MSAQRPLVAATLLATAVLTLTACGSDGKKAATAGSVSAAASAGSVVASAPPSGSAATSTTASTSASASASAKPTASHSATARPTSTGKPTEDCTTAAQRPGHRVVNILGADVGASEVSATATKFICGPDVDNDGYYQSAGSPAAFRFASGAQGELVVLDDRVGERAVPLPQLLQHADACGHHRPVDRPYSCFGGNYDVTVDGSGRITHITELYHP